MGGENQGLQIALIILFVLIVLLSVATSTLFTQNQQYDQLVKAVEQEKADLDAEAKKLTTEMFKLKEWIGLDPAAPDPGLLEAEKSFKDDMAKFAGSLPGDKQKYRFALEQTHADINTANEKTIQFTEQLKTLEGVNKQYEEAAKKQVDEAATARKKAEDDLAGQLLVFQDAQKKAEEEKKTLVAEIDKLQKERPDLMDAGKADIEKKDKEIAKLREENKRVQTTIKQIRGVEDIADDGEIRFINQRSRSVWVNVGRLDGLKPQVTFTVHAADTPPGASGKAKIQVTQILGDHLAEARIIEDSLTDPLVPGDKIYTALWDPGRTEHFYIAGRISIGGEGDGLGRLRSIISLSGGMVDGELDDRGTATGALTAGTRYLVLGDKSVQSAGKYDQLVKDAELLGVEAIGLDKFLDHVGWKTAPGGLTFGAGGNIGTSATPAPDGGIPSTTNAELDAFRQRRPIRLPPATAPRVPAASAY